MEGREQGMGGGGRERREGERKGDGEGGMGGRVEGRTVIYSQLVSPCSVLP